MGSYAMTNGGYGYGFGGGGGGGIGDFGAALYTGLGNAIPMLTQLYNFQDANALRQDMSNASAATMRNTTFGQGQEALRNYARQRDWLALEATTKKDMQERALTQQHTPSTIGSAANTDVGIGAGYVPTGIPPTAFNYEYMRNNPAVEAPIANGGHMISTVPTAHTNALNARLGLLGLERSFGNNPYGYNFGGM